MYVLNIYEADRFHLNQPDDDVFKLTKLIKKELMKQDCKTILLKQDTWRGIIEEGKCGMQRWRSGGEVGTFYWNLHLKLLRTWNSAQEERAGVCGVVI